MPITARYCIVLVCTLLLSAILTAGCVPEPIGDGLPDQMGCTECHGSENPAPPFSLDGEVLPSDPGVGAHQAHLADGSLRAAIACGECHQVPTEVDQPGHVDPRPAEVIFGALATTGDLEPVWERAPLTCESTWCHGGALSGGVHTIPIWTVTDGTLTTCGSCHGNPPPAPHTAATDCHSCHPGTVAEDGTIDLAAGRHMDGVIDKPVLACDTCHGDPDSPAPPLDTQGGSDTSLSGVGAHRSHLGPSTWHAELACSECHLVPTAVGDPGHNDDTLPAELTWGPLAASDGALPSFDPAGLTCSGTYCHGETLDPGGTITAPVWTTVDGSQAACGTCHGLPPSAPHPTDPNCENCHGDVIGPAFAWIDPSRHVDGVVDLTDYHPEGYDDGLVHGPDFNSDPAACQNCHGPTLAGGSVNVTCETCHPGFQANCVYCHGDTDNQTGAPPEDVVGDVATTIRGIGAHTAHVTTGSSWRADIPCSTCHVVPADALSPGHIDPRPAELSWTANAVADGAAPAFDGASGTCSGVYCHGETLHPGGSNTIPDWTDVGSGQANCGTCHGLPPGPPHPLDANCENCHADVIGAGFAWVDPTRHVDGVVDLTDYHPAGYLDPDVHGNDFNNGPATCQACHGIDLDGGSSNISCETCHPGFQNDCLHCHGDVNNQTGAPPEDVAGEIDTALRGTGAHTAHVTDGSSWRADIPCSACHVVPADALSPGHIDPRPAELTWTGTSVADGAAPAFDGTSGTCSAVYCHGETLHPGGSNTTPDWMDVGSGQANCGTCHGLPPGGSHPPDPNCENCHDEVIGAGFAWVDPSRHVDGVVDLSGGCGACHALPPTPANEHYPGGGGSHALHVSTLGLACFTCHGHSGSGPTHDQGGGTVLQSNVDLVFDPAVVFPGGTSMANGGTPSENYNGGNPTCFVGCHNPVPGDLADLDNSATWTDSSISCAECHDQPGTDLDIHHDLDPNVDDDATIRAACQECHDHTGHTGGSLTIVDPDPGDAWSYAGSGVSGQCRTCHDGGPGTYFSGRTPMDESVYWTTPTAHEEMGLDCDTCHDHHGTASGTLLVQREESLCAPCHASVVAEMNNANTPTHHHVVDSEQGGGTPLECTTCHDPHVVQRNPWRPMTDPDDGSLVSAADVLEDYTQSASGARNDNGQFCLDCHDGTWPGAINILAELLDQDVVNTQFQDNGENLHEKHVDKLNASVNDYPCTYCHNVHGSTGTDPAGNFVRGALLYSWLRVNSFPYFNKNSCSTSDVLDDCH